MKTVQGDDWETWEGGIKLIVAHQATAHLSFVDLMCMISTIPAPEPSESMKQAAKDYQQSRAWQAAVNYCPRCRCTSCTRKRVG